MNGKDLLIGLGNISHKYYDEAENATIVSEARHRSLKRPLLVAAIIAMMLLLVGCAVVYALRLQDMSIGTETYTQTFDDNGKYLDVPVEKTRDVLTLFGHSGDNIQKATAEWFAFLETYDPDGALMDNNPDHAEIPNQYEYTYGCYTADMAAKVDEIATKYDLKLLEEWIPFQAWQSDIFLEESGIASFLLPDCGAEMTHISGMYYPPYNFSMDFELVTDKLDTRIWGSIDYANKDFFPRDYSGGVDLSSFEQWDYTAPDGTPLLLALNNKGRAYIIAEPENAMLILYFDGNFSLSAYPEVDEILTKQELEAVADLFDYAIQPQLADRAVIDQKRGEAQAEYDAEHSYVPAVYGNFNAYLLDRYAVPDSKLQYSFYDLTGDGEEELLLGTDGAFTEWLTIRDGKAVPYGMATCYLCEGFVREHYETADELSTFERRRYFVPTLDGAYFGEDVENSGEMAVAITYKQGKWYQSTDLYGLEETDISETDAQKIISRYPRVELDWKPLMEYPLDGDGVTIGSYLEAKDIRVSDDELLQIYKDYLKNKADLYYTHYRILDINSDGVQDLLLSGDGERYWNVQTFRYGIMTSVLVADFYLCEDNIIERAGIEHRDWGVEVERHRFIRLQDMTVKNTLDFVAYNKATDSWESDYDATPMVREDAEAILAKYPRIDQGMRPISELLN